MKTSSLPRFAAALAAAALATAPAALGAEGSAATPAPGAAEAARTAALLAKFGDSVAEAAWTLRLVDDGRVPVNAVRYFCPSCGGWHSRSLQSYVAKRAPYRVPAFAVAPDKFVCADPMLRAESVERVEIRFRGETVAARVEASYPPPRCALLLVAEKPVPGVKPVDFAAAGKEPEEPAYFYVAREDGRLVAGVSEPSAADVELDAATGKAWTSGLANAILVDGDDEAVTISLADEFPTGEMDCSPPSKWETAAPDAPQAAAVGLEKRLAATILPVLVRLDPRAKEERGGDERSWRRTERNELDCPGVAVGGGRVLVVCGIGAEDAARLDKIEATLPGGRKVPLSFAGALRDHGAFAAEFEGGKFPEGVEPLRVSPDPPETRYRELLWKAEVESLPGAIRTVACPFFARSFDEGREGRVVLEDAEDVFLADGSAVQLAIPRRLGRSRWSAESDAFSGDRLEALARGDFDFDPEIVPRSGKDRVRVAWLGAEIQQLTEETAREKNAARFVGSKPDRDTDTDGALVVHVYPGSPAAKLGIEDGDILLFAATPDNSVRCEIESSRMSWEENADWDELWEEAPVQFFDNLEATPWPKIGSEADAVAGRFGIGSEIAVEWVHDGAFRRGTATVEAAPANFRTAPRARAKELGCIVADATFEVREFFKLDEGETGVVVTRCKAGSPAAVAGLKPFELVLKVDGEPVAGAKQFADAVRGKEEVQLTVRRISKSRVVRVRPKPDAGDAPYGPRADAEAEDGD